MENKSNDKVLKIVIRSLMMMTWLVLINGVISRYQAWADPFVQALLISSIPYIYYYIANTMIDENIFKINKTNAWVHVFRLVVMSFINVLLFLTVFPFNQISFSYFITNNQLNMKSAMLICFICYFCLAIIMIINLKRYGKQEKQ